MKRFFLITLVCLFSNFILISISDSADAIGARYGLRCRVKTVDVDNREIFSALLVCGDSDLVNVQTKSSLKSGLLTAAKQSAMPIVVDLAATGNANTADLASIHLP